MCSNLDIDTVYWDSKRMSNRPHFNAVRCSVTIAQQKQSSVRSLCPIIYVGTCGPKGVQETLMSNIDIIGMELRKKSGAAKLHVGTPSQWDIPLGAPRLRTNSVQHRPCQERETGYRLDLVVDIGMEPNYSGHYFNDEDINTIPLYDWMERSNPESKAAEYDSLPSKFYQNRMQWLGDAKQYRVDPFISALADGKRMASIFTLNYEHRFKSVRSFADRVLPSERQSASQVRNTRVNVGGEDQKGNDTDCDSE